MAIIVIINFISLTEAILLRKGIADNRVCLFFTEQTVDASAFPLKQCGLRVK